ERFACAVNHAGVFDLPLQYASDFTWGRPRNMGGEIWEAPEAVDKYNPARHAGGITTPMLVIHGEKDYRVPINQALECYGILKAKGVEARLLYFADENHWILKPKNSKRWYDEVLAWFNRYLS
nr:prolyl oligopeptidase family serine peptidase [Planctomycetota bacterium]